jgi:hypothetical protein
MTEPPSPLRMLLSRHTKRRDLIAGLLLMPLATPALAAMKQISILHSGFPNRTPIHILIEALRALGYENGNTAVMELLGGEGELSGWTHW